MFNEDTTGIDRELIAQELVRVARLARTKLLPDVAAEIEALADKIKLAPAE